MAPALTAPVLFLPGLLVEAAVRARNALYAAGTWRAERLPAPVASVGNLTLGGAGKTPLVIHLAGRLAALGVVPAILSRGYGRRERARSHIVPPGCEAAPSLVGDEPALLRRRAPTAWLGIARDRRGAGTAIAARVRNAAFILDDGFQHRRLHRDLDVVVIDRSQPLLNNRVVPRGTLREPLSALRRAHVIVLHGHAPGGVDAAIDAALRRIHPGAVVIHAAQRIASFVPYRSWRDGTAGGRAALDAPVFLVAAVGNPRRFRHDVEACGTRAVGERFFRDHHRITAREWRQCAREARRAGAGALVTTEKDAIKIETGPDLPLEVAVQSTTVEEGSAFERILEALVRGSR
jgi:tetraacyldisaccharide 4'-kinase